MLLNYPNIPSYSEPFRARRRREKENALRKAVKYIKQYHHPIFEEDVMEQAWRRADNFQICSCSVCGNPRHNDWASSHERLTFQERKAMVDMNQQFQDVLEKDCEAESKKQ